MYVEIYAQSDTSTRGKTSWLNTFGKLAEISLQCKDSGHLGSPPWHVQLTAKGNRNFGTGERGGEPKDIEYQVEIHLTPADLGNLVDFAVRNGLIVARPASTPRPPKRRGG